VPKRYSFYGKKIFDEIFEASPAIQRDFFDLLQGLRDDPQHLPGKALLGVLPLKDPRLAGAYTAPFDNGLLVYQVMADYPIIMLIQVSWLD
jgi:hypothetical protein